MTVETQYNKYKQEIESYLQQTRDNISYIEEYGYTSMPTEDEIKVEEQLQQLVNKLENAFTLTNDIATIAKDNFDC